jgi:hypothetical protein
MDLPKLSTTAATARFLFATQHSETKQVVKATADDTHHHDFTAGQ